MAKKIAFLFLFFAFSCSRTIAVSVMSVDIGNEFMKIAIVSPGKPMEIILNSDSSRKTPLIVAFRDGERFFGEAALSTATRFPEKSYTFLLDLIGKHIDSAPVKLYKKRFPYHNITGESKHSQIYVHHPEGMNFNESNPTHVLFYDMGSSSTSASIAAFQLVKTKEKGYVETNPQVVIKGVGFDRTLGGLEMQLRLRDHLAKLFAEQRNKKLETITSNKRAMNKLLKEAGRLKKVLSANTEHVAQVENVMDDVDLKAPVKRFKVKTFHVKEANIYPIQVEFTRTESEQPNKLVQRTLFTRNNLYPQKK
ncbi:Heat shock protein 70: conserved site-containing protein-like protein, partial [Leptotrombidium deliense]